MTTLTTDQVPAAEVFEFGGQHRTERLSRDLKRLDSTLTKEK